MNLIDGTVACVLMKPLVLFGLAAFYFIVFPFSPISYIYISVPAGMHLLHHSVMLPLYAEGSEAFMGVCFCFC